MEKKIRKALSYAKINLSLNVCGREESGMHLLDSVTASVSIADVASAYLCGGGQRVVTYGGKPSRYERDVVKVALDFMKEKFGDFGVSVDIEKRLPERAGVGGSSADAAAAIVLTCGLLGADVRSLDKGEIAARVGSDVPLMMFGGYARLGGVGGELEFFEGKPLWSVLCYGGDGVPTADCFALFDRYNPSFSLAPSDNDKLVSALKRGVIGEISPLCGNALEGAAKEICADIEKRLRALEKVGARAAFMTGSGSGCVGLFGDGKSALLAAKEMNRLYPQVGTSVALRSVPQGVELI